MESGHGSRHTGPVDHADPLCRIVTGVHRGLATAHASGRRIVPDGYADILWFPGATPFLAGPDTGPTVSVIPRSTPYVRVQLRRARATALTGAGLDETTDQRVDLDHLWRDRRWRRLADEADVEVGSRLLLDTLRDRMDDRWEPDHDIERILAGLDPHLGARQARRRFRHAMGYGQATFRRIQRFSHVRALCADGRDLATAAAQAGYSDQAHLSREVRRLTGLTPGTYFG